MEYLKFAKRMVMLFMPLLSLVLLAVACGAAATPTPVSKAPAAAVPKPAAPVAPAATPAAQPAPAQSEVRAAKVILLEGQWESERFDSGLIGAGANPYARIVHGFLIATNEDLKMIPGIASSWEVSKDGRTWSFTIRNGVRFHDGSELTVEDVLWSFRHSYGPEAIEWVTNSAAQSISRSMERVEQTGVDQVSLTTKKADSTFNQRVFEGGNQWYGIMPKRDKLHDEAQEVAYDKKPIGTGPMKLVQHVHADVMKFERFDDFYYQPKNGFTEDRRVKFTLLDQRLIPDEATRIAALRAREADIAKVNLLAKDQVEAGGGRLIFSREGAYFQILLNGCYDPQFPCHDKRVRQALDYAIDKKLFQDKLYGPEVLQIKGWGAVTPSTIGYSPELDPRPFDPVKARQLLAEAGYPGGKGFGKLIVHTFTDAIPFMSESAQLGADLWRRELGLDVEVKVGEPAAIKKAELVAGFKGQILWRDNDTRIDAASTTATYYNDPKTGRRLHEDPELYAIMAKALAVFDPVEREKTLNQLYRRLREESHQVSIGYVNVAFAVGPKIATWKPLPLFFFPTALHTIALK